MVKRPHACRFWYCMCLKSYASIWTSRISRACIMLLEHHKSHSLLISLICRPSQADGHQELHNVQPCFRRHRTVSRLGVHDRGNTDSQCSVRVEEEWHSPSEQSKVCPPSTTLSRQLKSAGVQCHTSGSRAS